MISIIIPAYNEEKRIINTLIKISNYMSTQDYEIIVVNDGSTDQTEFVVKTLNNPKIKLLNNPKNRGKGYSVKRGVYHACGDLILFSDADLSTPIEEFDKLKSYIDQGYGVVIGSRRTKGSDIKLKQPLYRRFLGKSFGLLVEYLAIKGIKDTQCGFKLFNGEIAKKSFSLQKINGFSFDVEVLVIAKKKFNASIKEVPVQWIDSAKESKVNALKESFHMLRDLLKIRLRF